MPLFQNNKERIAALSVLANSILAIGKLIIGFVSNSSAVLADGFHSLTDIFSSGIGYWGIRIAQKPEDKKHPYGHYKFEVMAGFFITLILLIAGIAIIYEGYQKFLNPLPLRIPALSLGIMIFSVLVNALTSQLKLYFGQKENSAVLLSDSFHDRADVFVSLAVFLGLVLDKYWNYADSLLAILIGLYIIKESLSLGKEAVDSLLDVAASPEIESKIREIVKNQKIELSNLKTQKKGSAITANLEINLPNNLSVEEATKTSENLRERLMKEIKNLVYVIIQIKSHEIETGFYQPSFGLGRGFGWQRRGRFEKEIENAKGAGPDGFCVCPQCGYKVSHKRGVPCPTIICPKCHIPLVRSDN
jgi:cation diffusion facilitator family transporter